MVETDRFRRELDQHQYRLEWNWRNEVDVKRGHRALLQAGVAQVPEMNMTVPTEWKDDPEAVAAVTWRITAVAAAGLTESIERLSFAWTADLSAPPLQAPGLPVATVPQLDAHRAIAEIAACGRLPEFWRASVSITVNPASCSRELI